jgi:long-chain acyl-CoA synthetase
MAVDTIVSRFFAQGQTRGTVSAYFVRGTSGWEPTNWATYGEQVRTVGKALIALGFEAGMKAVILGFNRPEWTMLDLATMAAGGVPAGIYTTSSPEEVAYITGHTDAFLALAEDRTQLAKFVQMREKLPALKWIVLMEGAAKEDGDADNILTWSEFLAKASGSDDAALDARIAALEADGLATLIYTSGTTGPPKGVMLSHHNLAWTAQAALDIVGVNDTDCSLSYLPLSHIAEQIFTLHVPCTAGSAVYFAQSLEKLKDNLVEVQPTVFFGVPRIWEKFYAAITAKAATTKGLKKKIGAWAKRVGSEYNDLLNRGGTPAGMLAWKYKLANMLVFKKVKPLVGMGRARFCVSGAAPISADIISYFAGLDIVIHEVYGQSEDTGPTSFNVPGRTRYGSVGPALPGVEVKIAEDDEILVKGPNVFLGYYKDQAATDACLIDGWLYSGDLGKFDSDGFLHITGRKKDLIITAGGKNVAPKNWESDMKNQPVIGEAVMFGDRQKYLTAVISLDPDVVAFPVTDLDAHQTAIQAWVDDVNSKYARVEQVKKFVILSRALSIDDGELTPTMKVKRAKVYEHFAKEIESMYGDDYVGR